MAEGRVQAAEMDGDGEVLFRFGFIADVQHADIPDAMNFNKSMKRFYKGSLKSLQEADSWWRKKSEDGPKKLSFIANLGDVLDGQNMDKEGDNMKAIGNLCSVFARADYAPFTVHLVGNHELYNFTRTQLVEGVPIEKPEKYHFKATIPDGAEPALPVSSDDKGFYFAFYPPGADRQYRVLVLDPYDISCMRDGGGRHGIEIYEGHGMDPAGLALLKEHNHNPVGGKGQVNFFEGMKGEEGRWVPFNGGFGEQQLAWLRKHLQAAQQESQRVLLLSHVILHPDATPDRSCRTLLWNFEEVLSLLREFPGVVPLVLCGHAHTGARCFDEESKTHHLTCYSPLEFPDSFGCCDVMADGSIRVIGNGKEPSWTAPPDCPAQSSL